MLFVGLGNQGAAEEPLTINQIAQSVQNGDVARIVIESDDRIRVVYKNGSQEGVESRKESDATLVDQLISLGVTPEHLSPDNVKIVVKAPSIFGGVLNSALYILPVLLMAGGVLVFFPPAPGSKKTPPHLLH